MTAQISDTIEHRGECFDIAGLTGHELFNPKDHGLNPVPMSSACWRGFTCTYIIDRKKLYLSSLKIDLGKPERLRIRYNRNPPTLFGVAPNAPVVDDNNFPWFGPAAFEDLHYRVHYTGGLLLARDFIRELYVHMGFHPAWKYYTVHELTFSDGNLIDETDRSQQVAEYRNSIADTPLKPGADSTRKEIKEWIAKCFTQNYHFVPEM